MSSITKRVAAREPARLTAAAESHPSPAAPALRSWPQAFLLALPAIALVTLQLWAAVAIFTYIAWYLLGGSMVFGAAAAAIAGLPGLWANWHVVRLAVAAERSPDA